MYLRVVFIIVLLGITFQVCCANEAKVSGSVIDSNYKPIQGVLVELGNQKALTDENGKYIINNVPETNKGLLTFSKDSYLTQRQKIVVKAPITTAKEAQLFKPKRFLKKINNKK